MQLAGAVILGVDIRSMNREGQRSPEVRYSRANVAKKQDCHMLNGKRYLQICGEYIFKSTSVFAL